MTDAQIDSQIDPQDVAEAVDEELLGLDPVTADEVTGIDEVDFPPTRYHAVPYADSDVTLESLDERHRQEEPDVFEVADLQDELAAESDGDD
jgi:hypothetical protein